MTTWTDASALGHKL